ncbi:hypothetical protein KCU67_g5450, partial [Aureobasidium melanogenum]
MASRINLLTRFLKTATTQNRTSATNTTTASSGTFQKLRDVVEENKNLIAENKKLLVDNETLRIRNYELKREVEEAYRQLWSQEIEGACIALTSGSFQTDLPVLPQQTQIQRFHNAQDHHFSSNNRTHSNQPLHTYTVVPKTKTISRLITVTMEATTETHNDLLDLLNEKNIALTETKAEAAQSANAVDKIIEENLLLKAENERLQAEIKELRIKLWDATEEERKMNAGRLHDVLRLHHTPPSTFTNDIHLQLPKNASKYGNGPKIVQRREVDTLQRINQDHVRTIDAMKKQREPQSALIEAYKKENETCKALIEAYKKENIAQKSTIDQSIKSEEQKLKTINEQKTQIKKLEKRIAQMKGSKKIQEEILALKAKRVDAEKKNEEEIAALKAKHAETGIETDKELQEREREL